MECDPRSHHVRSHDDLVYGVCRRLLTIRDSPVCGMKVRALLTQDRVDADG